MFGTHSQCPKPQALIGLGLRVPALEAQPEPYNPSQPKPSKAPELYLLESGGLGFRV